VITDESGNTVTDVNYTPFGESTLNGEEESYLYNEKEKDSSGLYYYGARYYDSDVGQFITRDPLQGKKAIPQSLNRYTYCLNNPVNLIDPTGLFCIHNVTTDVMTCITKYGWYMIGANGVTFSSNEIQELIDDGDYVGAVKRILEFLNGLGFDIQILEEDIEIDEEGNQVGTLTVSYLGYRVIITICGPKASAEEGAIENNWMGKTTILAGGKEIPMSIYFYGTTNMTQEKLFHTVGHEFVHAKNIATGDYDKWEKRWGTCAAIAYSEYLAWQWNLAHLVNADYPGAEGEFERMAKRYITMFFKLIK
jgi:RHS repeat-associated protein